MRKIYYYSLIGIGSLIGLSCQEENLSSKEEQPVELMANKDQIEYAKKNLLTLGNATVALANKDSEFKKSLYVEIEKTFDGDYNVLIKTLSNVKSKSGKSEDKINRSLIEITKSQSNSDKALTAFENVSNENYYPQVFIPFYDELKSEGKIGTSDPVFVVMVEDEGTSFPAYSVDGSGNLVETGLQVDEDYARRHEVWVLSINERVDSNGEISPDLTTENSSGRTKGAYYPNAKFEWVKCTVHKETWAAGASEVHIKRYMSFYDFAEYNDVVHARNYSGEDNVDDGDGWRIYQFSRRDVNDKKKIHRQWTYMSDWPNQSTEIENNQVVHTPYMYYVIFEYDAWPTALNTVNIPDAENQGTPLGTCYRSSELYYVIGYIPEGSANLWEVVGGGFWAQSIF